MNTLNFYYVLILVAPRITDNKIKCFALNYLYSQCHFHDTAFCSLANKLGTRVDSALYCEYQDCFEVHAAVKNKRDNVRVTYIEARSCNHCCSGKNNKYYIFCACLCSLRYPAYNAHAPFCHLWPAPLYNIFFFSNYLINGKIFEKKNVIEHKMCILILSTTLSETHSKKN